VGNHLSNLTLLGLVASDGVDITSVVSVPKQRVFESGWINIDANRRLTFNHNLIYPIKNDRLYFREFPGSEEYRSMSHTGSYGMSILHKRDKLNTTVSSASSGTFNGSSDDETPSSFQVTSGQVNFILEG